MYVNLFRYTLAFFVISRHEIRNLLASVGQNITFDERCTHTSSNVLSLLKETVAGCSSLGVSSKVTVVVATSSIVPSELLEMSKSLISYK